MNDRNKIKLPKKVNHYPVDTHLSKCCLRECPMKNVKGKEEHIEQKYKFVEKKVFHFKKNKGYNIKKKKSKK